MNKWKDKLNITEVSKAQAEPVVQPIHNRGDSSATEQERQIQEYGHMFKKDTPSLHTPYYAQQREEKEKDSVAMALFMLGIMGVFYLVAPSSVPAVGKAAFMGLDIDLWFWLIKTVSIFSGAAMIPALIWKLRGDSVGLKAFLNILPNKGKFSLKLTTSIFLASFLGGGLLHMTHNDLFKTHDQWQVAEALKTDSRDPVKRDHMVNVISPALNDLHEGDAQKNMSDIEKALNQHIIVQSVNNDPLTTEQERLIQQKIRTELVQEENEKVMKLQQNQDQRLQEILQQKIKSIPQVQ